MQWCNSSRRRSRRAGSTRVLVRAILKLAASGGSQPAFVQPVPWLVAAQRATASTLSGRPHRRVALGGAGSDGAAERGRLAARAGVVGHSTVVARYDLAAAVAAATPDGNAALTAATGFDLDALAGAPRTPRGSASPPRPRWRR